MWSDIWQNAGWGTIIYLAALSAVDPELHEAAIVDGATKLQRIRHIDIPGILPIAVILLILEMGRMMSIGFEKAYLMKNPLNADTAEIIATYVYEGGHRKRPVQLLRRGRLLQFRDQPDPADHGQPGRQEAERDQPVVSGRGHSVTRKTLKIDVQASPAGRHFRARP